jgi:hypothetical protein
VVLDVSELLGVKVATVLAPLKVTIPATGFPPESFSVNDTVLGTTAWENVAVGATETGLPVDPAFGVTLDTVGVEAGVTALDAADAGPVPFALVAVTVKV